MSKLDPTTEDHQLLVLVGKERWPCCSHDANWAIAARTYNPAYIMLPVCHEIVLCSGDSSDMSLKL